MAWTFGWRGLRSALGVVLLSFVLLCGCATTVDPAQPGGGSGDGGIDDDQPPADDRSVVAREIEEADIIKYHDGYLYLANPYRGLRIIDVETIERPEIVGGVEVGGRAIELFVREDRAYMVTSADFFYCAGEPVSFGEAGSGLTQPGYVGSQLAVFDVADRYAPERIATFPIPGYVVATQRVGDVIYLAGNELEDFDTNGAGQPVDWPEATDVVFVESINIADPDNPQAIEYVQVSGAAEAIQTSSQAVYVAGDDPDMDLTTRVVYVDISDPGGDIEVRDVFRVPGVIFSRFFLSEFDDTLRVVTQDVVGSVATDFRNRVSLYNYDISNPDDVDRLARLVIDTEDFVTAVRFEGERGYVVTYGTPGVVRVLDLGDPADPQIAGEISSVGVSAHVEPLGDRLLTVGFTVTGETRPTLALYDVSNPESPRRLDSLTVGLLADTQVDSEAIFDEKALTVIEDEGLILLPFSYRDPESLDYVDSVQVIDLLATQIESRAQVDHRGLVRRADVLDDRLWILSDVAFQVVDIDVRFDPVSLSTIDIISQQQLLDAGLLDCVDSARYRTPPDVPNVDIRFPGGRVMCGAVSYSALTLTFAGLVTLRFTFRRPRVR